MEELISCTICPRKCKTNRFKGKGLCGAGDKLAAAKAFLHQWEEPCISGTKGSGTIFFSGCNMHCAFCQNHKISQEGLGKEITIDRLADIMIELQAKGAANINFVSPTPYALHIVKAVKLARKLGLMLPIVYNTNGYETVEIIEALNGTVDIYLPDIKYFKDTNAMKYSGVKGYFEHTSNAILAMINQVGYPIFDEYGMMKKGVLIRHLIMPEMLDDSKSILRWIKENLGKQAYVSLMCQYTPMFRASAHEELNRKLDDWEYEYIVDYFFKLGLENGFVQDYSSATAEYTPDFDLTGV